MTGDSQRNIHECLIIQSSVRLSSDRLLLKETPLTNVFQLWKSLRNRFSELFLLEDIFSCQTPLAPPTAQEPHKSDVGAGYWVKCGADEL